MKPDHLTLLRLEDILPDLSRKRTPEQNIAMLVIAMQEVKSRLHALENRLQDE